MTAAVLLAPKRLQRVLDFAAKHPVPVDAGHHGADLGRRSACGVAAADKPAHAGAGDRIDRNPVFLEPFEHSDVCEPARAAAAERQPDAGPARRLLRVRHGSSGGRQRGQVRQDADENGDKRHYPPADQRRHARRPHVSVVTLRQLPAGRRNSWHRASSFADARADAAHECV